MQTKSPFLGMDPFLEDRHEWPGVHARLTVVVCNLILANLPTNFSAKVEGGVRIFDQEWDYTLPVKKPDVYITKNSPIRAAQPEPVTIAEPTTYFEVEAEAVTPRWIEIVDLKSRQMVTAIEILSPSNKGRDFHTFNQKRSLVVEAGGNWVEIDLLRKGKRPQPFLFDTDYYALMIRSGERHWRVWEMSLQQPLQTIGIPLSDGYSDVPLDLQKAIETVYTEGEYWRDLMYDQPVPPPRLPAENQAYIEQKLTAWKTAQP